MVKQTIKIFGRLKPTKKNLCVYEIQSDETEKDRILFAVPRDSKVFINNTKEEFKFQFDHIFERDAKQEEVFENVARDVIDNCLSGYNGTIFAYGQTGSGKTFTITGGAEKYSDRGIIPRCLEYLFSQFEKQPNLAFQTHISYLEIYNESGYDLLDPNKEIKKMEDLPKVALMEDSDGSVHLRNLSIHQANSEEDALNLLFIGDTNRMVAETPMNQASTRSHCIFTIHISSREPGSATIRKAKLHLVDLAGSERVHKTGVNGTLLTEAKYINVSLHFLEQVIVSLSEKNRTHIPYRNSLMTSVLRDSLGGNCMTTMVATLSAELKNIDESISTCRFAQRVALIKNDVSVNEELDPRLMVAKLKKEVQELKTQLAMGSEDGMMLTEALGAEELDNWKVRCRKYLDDKDPEAVLETGPDLRKILACFKFLKAFYNEAVKSSKALPTSARSTLQQATVHETPNMQMVPMSAYDSKEVQELKHVLKQRDNEINILVSMLKKEKAKNLNTSSLTSNVNSSVSTNGSSNFEYSTAERRKNDRNEMRESYSSNTSAYSSAPEQTKNSVNMSRESTVSTSMAIDNQNRVAIGHSSNAYSHKATVNNIVQKKMGDMSVGRQEAFEIFKRDYRDREGIERKKAQLKECYATAKHKGQAVNHYRLKINELKAALQQCRISAAVGGAGDSGSGETSEEERRLRQSMEREKEKYKELFDELKQTKNEIEHLQHMLEQDKLLIVKEFEAWWATQEQKQEQKQLSHTQGDNHYSRDSTMNSSKTMTHSTNCLPNSDSNHQITRNSSSSSSSLKSRHISEANSSSGASNSQSPSPINSSIPLTGDAKADADIIAFFKARQKALGPR